MHVKLRHVGECRAWRYASGTLTQLTKEHTLVTRMVAEYTVACAKYRQMHYDARPYLDTERTFPSFEEAVAWMEEKTGILFANMHR